MDEISIAISEGIGDHVAFTAILKVLQKKFPDRLLRLYVRFPEIFLGYEGVEIIKDPNISPDSVDIDLRNYEGSGELICYNLKGPLLDYSYGRVEKKLGVQLDYKYNPEVRLTKEELGEARRIVDKISFGKPLIWLQTKTSREEKDMPEIFWEELVRRKKEFSFVDLSSGEYSLRIAMAITKFCLGGIVLDTFLLHGSKAVGAKNVIGVMVKTPLGVSTYKDQIGVRGYEENWEKTLEEVISKIEKF